MSDYIHVELQIKIMKILPVKSLIKFRTVSKPWKSLIDSFEFMADYTQHQQQQHPLLLIGNNYQSRHKYVSLLDDDTFDEHKFVTTTLPMQVKDTVEFKYLVGSSHGLFCFNVCYDDDIEDDEDDDVDDEYYDDEEDEYYQRGRDIAVIWNPSIRKSVAIKVPKKYSHAYGGTNHAFGVLPITFDPMIIKIARLTKLGEVAENGYWRIYIYTLSSGSWKSVRDHLPDDSIKFDDCHVDINGFIYWQAYKGITIDSYYGVFDRINVIISFDMTSHDFRELYLPTSLAQYPSIYMSVSKLRESLVVLQLNKEVFEREVCTVWMMMDDHGVPNSFKKLYTIKPTDASVERVLGFTDSGAPIIEKKSDDDKDTYALSVYDTDSQKLSEIGIYGGKRSLSVNSYTETLLMLNHPDSRED